MSLKYILMINETRQYPAVTLRRALEGDKVAQDIRPDFLDAANDGCVFIGNIYWLQTSTCKFLGIFSK